MSWFPGRHRSSEEPPAAVQDRPGSAGEHMLQQKLGTAGRAEAFYHGQVRGELTPRMTEFIARMEMMFIATAGSKGECDCSFRAGPPGFIRTPEQAMLLYPEYRGNGVMASLGNITENPHIGIWMGDFAQDLVGLHVNGRAGMLTRAEALSLDPELPPPGANGRKDEHWVVVIVGEAYIHCSKHIPKLVPQSRVRHWGTDNPRHKGGDYFGAAGEILGPGRH